MPSGWVRRPYAGQLQYLLQDIPVSSGFSGAFARVRTDQVGYGFLQPGPPHREYPIQDRSIEFGIARRVVDCGDGPLELVLCEARSLEAGKGALQVGWLQIEEYSAYLRLLEAL